MLGERALANNFFEYLYTANYFSFHFDKVKMKKKKYVVLLLPFFISSVSISY